MENYVHQISPIALQIYGNIAIRWYGLAYLGGLLLGLLLMKKMSDRGGNKLNTEQLSDLVTWSALGVMLGGRVGYCLFYSPHLLFDFSSSFPFWSVLKVWEGGMSSHGGMLGVLVSSYLFSRKHKLQWFHVADLTVVGASLGFFFGRLANFINGELYGRVVEKPISWAVKFPGELVEWTKAPEKLKALAPGVEKLNSLGIIPDSIKITDWSQLVSQYNTSGNARAVVENTITWIQNQATLKNQEVISVLADVLPSRYPSQLIQALLEGLLVFIALNIIWLKPRKPGVLAASFGILYSIARVIGEQYRMPDSQLGFQALGLTRGQWLSFGLLAFAVLALFIFQKRDVEKIKGWAK